MGSVVKHLIWIDYYNSNPKDFNDIRRKIRYFLLCMGVKRCRVTIKNSNGECYYKDINTGKEKNFSNITKIIITLCSIDEINNVMNSLQQLITILDAIFLKYQDKSKEVLFIKKGVT